MAYEQHVHKAGALARHRVKAGGLPLEPR